MSRWTWKALLVLGLPCVLAAHDIPNDVTVQLFVKPSGNHLDLLVRVPMIALRDMDPPKRGPGYLDLAKAGPVLRDAATLWISDALTIYESDSTLPKPRVLGVQASLLSDRSFVSFESALAHITGPRLPEETEIVWNQALLDVWFQYPIASDRSQFSIRSTLGRLGLRVVTVLRFLPPGGAVRAFEFSSDPGLLRLDPRWFQAALRFVREGFLHILDGTDHLLFLFCLVIPFRKFRSLIPIVTSFTVAHSLTLIASAYNLGPDALWFPPLIETLIAASIVYMALENIVGGATVNRRWMITFGFGLVHGFGFSFALRQSLQFAGAHLLTSLLSFNIGVELGQLLVLLLMIPFLEGLFHFAVKERMGTIILSALVAHTGWHWMTDRWDRLRQFSIQGPAWSAAMLAGVFRWLMLVIGVAGLLWLVFGLLRQRSERGAEAPSSE